MHIGILVTNTDRSDFAKARASDGEKFTTLLHPLRTDWQFTPVQVVDGEFPKSVSDFDGYVIGGSPASVNEAEPWIETLFDFIREINRKAIPTVGVCFGHQAIAKALGGHVGKNPGGWGWGLAATHFQTHEKWMMPDKKIINLFAAHNEQVTDLPESAEILGGSDFCPVGSFSVGDHIMTTQYHPEMDLKFFAELTHDLKTYIGRDIAEAALRSTTTAADTASFAHWMVQFLEQKR